MRRSLCRRNRRFCRRLYGCFCRGCSRSCGIPSGRGRAFRAFSRRYRAFGIRRSSTFRTSGALRAFRSCGRFPAFGAFRSRIFRGAAFGLRLGAFRLRFGFIAFRFGSCLFGFSSFRFGFRFRTFLLSGFRTLRFFHFHTFRGRLQRRFRLPGGRRVLPAGRQHDCQGGSRR